MQFERQIEFLKHLKGQAFVLDLETTGLHWYGDGAIGVGIHCPELEFTEYIQVCNYTSAVYGRPKKTKVWNGDYGINPLTGRKIKIWDITEEYQTRTQAVPIPHLLSMVTERLEDVASDPATCIIGHNLKFDLHFQNLNLYNKPCKVVDTAVLVHLFDSRMRKSLDVAEKIFLGTNSKRAHVSQAPKGLAHKPWLWPLGTVRDYCLNDCIVTYQLAEVIGKKIKKLNLIDLFNIEMEYIKTMWTVERRGIELDIEFCKNADRAFGDNLKLMEEELMESVGYDFNWRSNPQLSVALYDHLGIPKPKNPYEDENGVDHSRIKGKYNKWNTSSFLLMEKAHHPLGGLVMDLRETSKLRKTVQSYIKLSAYDGLIHTSFRTEGTITGRLSSREPNIQNIASQHRVRETQSAYSGGAQRQDEYNLRIAFKARAGHTFVSVDARQQEMRMFAVLAREPDMMKAILDRLDIHHMIAIMVWGDCGKERNKLHREWSKTVAFGLLYGMTTGSLVVRLNKTQEEADEITDAYFGKFPRIRPWLNACRAEVEEQQWCRLWNGRIWREDEFEQAYKSANARIQGGAAGLIQIAAMRVQKVLLHQEWGSIVSIIHDEILCEIKDEFVEIATPVIMRIMEVEDLFDVPFATEAKIGPTYGSLTEYEPDVHLASINWLDYAPWDFDITKYYIQPYKYGGDIKIDETVTPEENLDKAVKLLVDILTQ